MPFRSTPQLGPQFDMHDTKFHWDGENIDVSYRLGNPEEGSDGHDYILVKAGANHAASARLDVNDTTWVTTANAGGAWMVPADIIGGSVASGEYFHARRFAL